MTSVARHGEDGATLVEAALIMPLLAFALGAILHLGLYLLSRQVVVTAVQQGLTAATAADGTTAQGKTIASQLIAAHSAAEILDLTATATSSTVTLTATVRTPAVVPGLTRTVTVAQSAAKEQWVAP